MKTQNPSPDGNGILLSRLVPKGERDNRYSGQLEIAPNYNQNHFGEDIKKSAHLERI